MEECAGYCVFKTDGDKFFSNEYGGHRWQRIPPNERRGRVHTSTVTVAVLRSETARLVINESEIVVEYYKAPGKGGQKRNKCESACRLKYRGLIVTCCDERSKFQNYDSAMKELHRRLEESHRSAALGRTNDVRKSQIGSGQRGDKIRTYRTQDDSIVDHRTGKRVRLSAAVSGKVWF